MLFNAKQIFKMHLDIILNTKQYFSMILILKKIFKYIFKKKYF